MRVQFDIRGSNRVRNQLRGLAAAHPEETGPVVEKHTKWAAAQMRRERYPAERPNQTYRRTYELRRRFRAQKVKAAVWRVINLRPGAVWVIKKGMQNRKVHLGRWWTLEDKLQKTMPRLTRKLTDKLDDIMEAA